MTIDKAELKERLSAEITEIAKSFEYSPDKLSEFLSFGSRFRGYSYKNVQLIYAQRPTATFVAPASRYFAGLPSADGVPLSKDPLYIKKGERAIYIFAPCEVTYYSCGGSSEHGASLPPAIRRITRQTRKNGALARQRILSSFRYSTYGRSTALRSCFPPYSV